MPIEIGVAENDPQVPYSGLCHFKVPIVAMGIHSSSFPKALMQAVQISTVEDEFSNDHVLNSFPAWATLLHYLAILHAGYFYCYGVSYSLLTCPRVLVLSIHVLFFQLNNHACKILHQFQQSIVLHTHKLQLLFTVVAVIVANIHKQIVFVNECRRWQWFLQLFLSFQPLRIEIRL